MALSPYQEQIVRTALALPEAAGFALAGGGAMLAHQLVERPTQDIDLFTTLDRSVPGFARSLSDAMTAAGSSVTVVQQSDTFARLLLTGPEGASTTVDLAHDPRLVDAVRLDVGPVLAPEDVIADKTLALWGRAEARDLIDVDALATRFGPDQLLRLAAAKDPGFDPALMPAAITTAANRDPAVYASLGVTGPALDQLRTRAHTWAAQLTSQHTAAAEPTARELAADCFPAPPQQATQRPGQADRAAEPSPPPHIRRSPGQDRDHGR